MQLEQTPHGEIVTIEGREELSIVRAALAATTHGLLPLIPYPSGSRHAYATLAREVDIILSDRHRNNSDAAYTLPVRESQLCLHALERNAAQEPSLPKGATTGYGALLKQLQEQ